MKRSESGYTLLEIVVVIAIIGILTTMAVTNYSEQIPHQQLRDASSALVGELRLARQKAIFNGKDEIIPIGMHPLPGHVRFSASNVTKNTYNEKNLPDDGISFVGNSATFYSIGTGESGTIYLTNSKKESVAITVNITGRVRKYLWDGHDWK